jgi:hypothetical protein
MVDADLASLILFSAGLVVDVWSCNTVIPTNHFEPHSMIVNHRTRLISAD